MSDPQNSHFSDRTIWIALAAVAMVVAAPFALTWYLNERSIHACEARIMAELKAPSSYRRIKVDGSAVYDIEFDAANSFGTPIRGSAMCIADGTTIKAFYLRPEPQA